MSIEGMIPVNAGDIPIDVVTMEESGIYNGILRQVVINPKLSKKQQLVFCMAHIEVADGDYEGRTVNHNYIPLPINVTQDMSKAQRIRAMDISTAWGRFQNAFRITGDIPTLPLVGYEKFLQNAEGIRAWHEWVSKFYGNQGKFQIRNQEFPEGSGRMRSGVSDFSL